MTDAGSLGSFDWRNWQHLEELARDRALALLVAIDAECANLLGALNDIAIASTLTDAAARGAEIQTAWATFSKLFESNSAQIKQLIADLTGVLTEHPQLGNFLSPVDTTVANVWERTTLSVAGVPAPAAADAISQVANQCVMRLREMRAQVALVVVPDRLVATLLNMRTGSVLNFHTMFEGVLPDLETRTAFLRQLSLTSLSLPGVIDVERGLVTRGDPDPRKRRLSLVRILLMIVASIGVVAIVAFLVEDWPALPGKASGFARWKALGFGYVAVLAGAVVHAAVGFLKGRRGKKPGTATVAEDPVMWIHVREGSIAVALLGLLVVLFGASAALDTVPRTMFFVGYTSDSLLDLFIERFEKVADARVTNLTKELS